MAIERKWKAIPPHPITIDGTVDGHITVATSVPFKVKQIVFLSSNTLNPLEFQVKRVNSLTDIILGPVSTGIDDYTDVSGYLVSDSAVIYSLEQPRNKIDNISYGRAVYEEEPTSAIRTILVDELGDIFSLANPIPVELSNGSIAIGTVNNNLEVQLSAKDNDPDMGDVHSSVRIGDGTNEVKVNSDGSLNVVVQNGSGQVRTTQNVFNEVTGIVSGVTTQVTTYTVPVGKTAILEKVSVSGDTIAKFDVYLNLIQQDTRRTYWSDFNEFFDFISSGNGLSLATGDEIIVQVVHMRPDTGTFSSRIQVVELS